jgi:phosphoribosyl 1,2-cyclic phosphate phosphodiesterase
MMKAKDKFLFLGTGGSMGIPVIGCECAVCRSDSPFNKRLRPSGLLKINDKAILIDCGPDFRAQMLQHNIKHLDGVIFTHAHYDHTGGFDELRIFNVRSKHVMPCLLSHATAEDLKMRFPYVFDESSHFASITTKAAMHYLPSDRGSMDFLGIPLSFMTYEQGGMSVNGFRFGNFAYISDIRHYPSTIFEDLQGVETLVISCLRYQPSVLHFNIEEAVAFSEKLQVKQAWFTHIAHELDHELTNSRLPPNYQLAYDGLEIDIEIPHRE